MCIRDRCEDDVKYTIPECKERDATYAAPLKVKVRLHNKEDVYKRQGGSCAHENNMGMYRMQES